MPFNPHFAGTMGLTGNLSAGEIVEQLAYASQLTRIRNIVFMGMGEPLNNYRAVKVCLEILERFLYTVWWLSAPVGTCQEFLLQAAAQGSCTHHCLGAVPSKPRISHHAYLIVRIVPIG